MFTGIVECTARIVAIENSGSNRIFWMESPVSDALKVDQSVAHNGVCLTVDAMAPGRHRVTAIEETLKVTALGNKQVGDVLNLERSLRPGDRLDGHWVQGHVDTVGHCTRIEPRDGSWNIGFEHPVSEQWVTVRKGSICVDGVSLTVVDSHDHGFSVSIIPYTFEHTGFGSLQAGQMVNLEFDILGKYMARLLENRRP
ncbi:riboflavin synthase [bacterium]|nr:riboflavin synthase [bacterium]